MSGSVLGAGGNGAALEYLWDFGGGETSDEAEPTFTFANAGEYTIRLKVTDPNTNAEGTASRTITVADSADLTVDDVQFVLPAGKQAVGSGDTLRVSWTVENKGDAVRGDWEYVVVLSKDRTFGSGDKEIHRGKHAGDFAVGTAENEEVSFELPDGIEDGRDWILGVILDPEERVGDDKKRNNVFWSVMPLTVRNGATSGPDLRNCGVRVVGLEQEDLAEMPRGQLGRSIDVEFCVRNIGDRPAAMDSPYALYFSRDESVDNSDIKVFEGRFDPLAPVSEEVRLTQTVSLQEPLTTGEWYLIYVVDPESQIIEQNEDNNVSLWARTLTIAEAGEVEGVDLTITSVTFEANEVFWGASRFQHPAW